MLSCALREPPATDVLYAYATEPPPRGLGLTLERWPLARGVRALYCDRTLVVARDLPPEVVAEWDRHWRYLLAVVIAAAKLGCGPILFRWPMETVGELPQDKERAALGAGPVLMGTTHHRTLHHLSVPEQARYLGVPEVVWTRWVRLHQTDCERSRELRQRRHPPTADLPPVNG